MALRFSDDELERKRCLLRLRRVRNSDAVQRFDEMVPASENAVAKE